MDKKRFWCLSIVLVVVFVATAQAQALPSFFCTEVNGECVSEVASEGVLDIFHTNEIKVNSAEDFILHRPRVVVPEEEEVAEEKPLEEKKTLKKDLGKIALKSAEEIKEVYGDPNEPEPILADEKAPRPYKAMLQALHIGDEKLAYAYARKYVVFMRDLRESINKAMILQGLGQYVEGEKGEDSWVMGEEYKEYHDLLKEDLGEMKKPEANKPPTEEEIQTKAIEALEKAKTEYAFKSDAARDSVILELDEDQERGRARRSLTGQIPVDRQGPIEVMFFFRDQDQNAIGIAPDIQRLHQALSEDPRADVKAFTIDQLNKANISDFRQKTGADFPVISGKKFAESFGISKSPTVVLVTIKDSRFHIIEKAENYFYLHEAVQIMKGE